MNSDFGTARLGFRGRIGMGTTSPPFTPNTPECVDITRKRSEPACQRQAYTRTSESPIPSLFVRVIRG